MALAPSRSTASAARRKSVGKPFLGLIDAIVVDAPAEFSFEGSVTTEHAEAAWIWMTRDLASDLIDADALEDLPNKVAALDSLVPDLLNRARKALHEVQSDPEAIRRIKSQLGGEEAWAKLPVVLNALRCRSLLEKAQSFGRAANGMNDEAALALALQSMPLQDQPVASLLMHAAVGQVAAPARLVTAAIRIANNAQESALVRAGFAPLINAILAHAQNQIPPLNQVGTFGDMDLVCRSVDRFHRLLRAVTGYVELDRGSSWSTIAAQLTKAVSERLDPKLRDVAPDLNLALRRRDGADRVDGDRRAAEDLLRLVQPGEHTLPVRHRVRAEPPQAVVVRG